MTREAAAETRVLAEHRETVTAVCETGRAVAESWDGTTASEGSQVTGPLADRLGNTLREALLETVGTAAAVFGSQIEGTPVPAPPYLVVTSRGPICRVTLADGRRLVLCFALFAVERRPRTYRFRDPSPECCLDVTIHAR